jgi:hypothetical protein
MINSYWDKTPIGYSICSSTSLIKLFHAYYSKIQNYFSLRFRYYDGSVDDCITFMFGFKPFAIKDIEDGCHFTKDDIKF